MEMELPQCRSGYQTTYQTSLTNFHFSTDCSYIKHSWLETCFDTSHYSANGKIWLLMLIIQVTHSLKRRSSLFSFLVFQSKCHSYYSRRKEDINIENNMTLGLLSSHFCMHLGNIVAYITVTVQDKSVDVTYSRWNRMTKNPK